MRLLFISAAAFLMLFAYSNFAFANKSCGVASWYSMPGQKTANGERMNPNAMTAAHKSLRFGTKLMVTNPRNGRKVVVRINDRGPFTGGRILDLSKAAASKLGYIRKGRTKVCFSKIG